MDYITLFPELPSYKVRGTEDARDCVHEGEI